MGVSSARVVLTVGTGVSSARVVLTVGTGVSSARVVFAPARRVKTGAGTEPEAPARSGAARRANTGGGHARAYRKANNVAGTGTSATKTFSPW